MTQPFKPPQADNSILSIRVDDLELPSLVVEKLLNRSIRTVRRLKNLTTERMRKIGITDEEIGLIKLKLEELFEKGYLPKITFVTNECPKCGSLLVKRNGKFGEFMGCPKYPKCTFARKTV